MKTFFAWTLLFSLLGINCAHADFEAVETTLGKLEDVQKEAQNVQEELKKVQAAMNAVRQGEFGPLEEVKSNILNEKKVDVKLIGPIAEKVGDTKELEGAVEENIIPQYTDKDQDKAVKAAGMEDEGVTIHSLRHTYASFAIAQGADVKTLQMQLGHSSPSITLNTYTALWPERLDDVADAIGALRERELV